MTSHTCDQITVDAADVEKDLSWLKPDMSVHVFRYKINCKLHELETKLNS